MYDLTIRGGLRVDGAGLLEKDELKGAGGVQVLRHKQGLG